MSTNKMFLNQSINQYSFIMMGLKNVKESSNCNASLDREIDFLLVYRVCVKSVACVFWFQQNTGHS